MGYTGFDDVNEAGGRGCAARGSFAELAGIALGALLVLFAPAVTSAGPTAEQVLSDLPFGDGERKRILGGELVRTTTAETSDRELAVGMAFIIKEPPPKVVENFRTAGNYRLDSMVRAFGELQGEGSLADFEKLRLEPGGEEMAKRYLDAKPGEDLNLDQNEIDAFRALEEKGGASPVKRVEEQLRRMLLARYRAYRARGLNGISHYARGRGRDFQPAEGMRKPIEAATVMKKYAPDFVQALLDYPKNQPEGFQERFFWVNFEIDGEPTFVLNHRSGMSMGGQVVLAERHYYVSRSHNWVQALGGLLPVPEGALVFYLNRTSTDRVAGFGASAKQSLGRRIMGQQIAALFEKMRTEAATE